MKLLIIKQEFFVDPHGSAEPTLACNKFVSENENFLKLNNKYARYEITDSDFNFCIKEGYDIDEYLSDENSVYEHQHELSASEDGYNSKYFYYSVREITEEEYSLFKEVIKNYDKIK